MPKGVYVREQEQEGYLDRAYWARRVKEQAGFLCEVCGDVLPARFLTVEQVGPIRTLESGLVLCPECAAIRYFDGPVLTVATLLEATNLPISERQLRSWVAVGLIPSSFRGYLPYSLLTRVALLHFNRNLTTERLHVLVETQEVKVIQVRNLQTDKDETLTVIEEYPVSLNGRDYLCRRLLDGDLLILSKRKE